MTKKLLPLLAFMLALICTMTSCGGKSGSGGGSSNGSTPGTHTHAFGQWETVKVPTATEKGQQKRICSCGEFETQDIPELTEDDLEKSKSRYFPVKVEGKTEREGLDYIESSVISFSYNEKGFPVQRSRYNYVQDYICDENGKLIQETITLGNIGSSRYVYYYTYDANGNLIQMLLYTRTNGNTNQKKEEHTYDESGKRIKSVYTNFYGIRTEGTYTYDEKGNLIKFIEDGYNTDYFYDTNGNLIKETITGYGEEQNSRTYTYNEKGDLIKKVVTSNAYAPPASIISEYTYDTNGNLIKIVEENNLSKSKTTYDIEYQLFDFPIGITDKEYEDWIEKLLMD